MKKGELLKVTIKDVRLHKEERRVIGASSGLYSSNYVAHINEYPNGIVVIDDFVSGLHSDWKRKTEERADKLSNELKGKQFQVEVREVGCGHDCFESVIRKEESVC